MWQFKRRNEQEKREFVKELIQLGRIKPADEEEAVESLLNCEITIKRA